MASVPMEEFFSVISMPLVSVSVSVAFVNVRELLPKLNALSVWPPLATGLRGEFVSDLTLAFAGTPVRVLVA